MAAISSLLNHLDKVRIPTNGDKIYKDECVYSFDNPDSDTGLYVCLNTFLGLGLKHIERHYHQTGNPLYLHIKRIKKALPQTKPQIEPKKVTKLAIGIEGGFDVNEEKKYEYEEFYSVIVLPDFVQIPYPHEDLPHEVQLSINTILASDSAAKVEEAQALSGTWDGEKRKVSKHANTLQQLDNGVKIPPKGWKCQMCDKTDNLWLNLTDGAILCGRKYHDGSGGNNHAVEHYHRTRYPLVVKLGTITASGGDVYSYDEDDMVEDPNLAGHLAHFGINVAQLEKSDKSMIELELELNQCHEWNTIQEAGCQLKPLYGPGYTGLANLGNSCYLNSVMQVVFYIPDFQKKYYDNSSMIFQNAPTNPTNDFTTQMAKLGFGLLSGEYSKFSSPDECGANEYQPGIKLHMFKSLIGKGHPEFSSKRQQDAQEFFLHLINTLERNNRNQENPADCFKFQLEEKIKCLLSGKVKYTTRTEYSLPVPIPLDAAVNQEELEAFRRLKAERIANGQTIDPSEVVQPFIPFSACLHAFMSPETVDDFYSTAINSKSTAQKTTLLRTFPDYLFINLKKYTVGDDWTPLKLDVRIDMPDFLDLECLRGTGLQPGEEELPDTTVEMTSPEIILDPNTISQLSEMGFPLDACKRAAYKTNNTGTDAALNWIMEHMNDTDYAAPFVLPTSMEVDNFAPNPEALATIVAMGFTEEQAIRALKATENNLERAADWIFSHVDELGPSAMDTGDTSSLPNPKFRDGSEKYKLVAFISHMGNSTMVGHYVCHILRDGHWVIYNDNKVALSERPPKDMGYLYLYERI